MRKWLTTLMISLVFGGTIARAQPVNLLTQLADEQPPTLPTVATTWNSGWLAGPTPEPQRDRETVGLYALFATTQGLDVLSTLRGRSQGLMEANPLMLPVVDSPALFIAAKSIMTILAIRSAERLRKQGHPKAAKVLLVILSGETGFATINNARQLK